MLQQLGRIAAVATAAVLLGGLVFSLSPETRGQVRDRSGSVRLTAQIVGDPRPPTTGSTLRPLLAVLGASFAAGIGASSPSLAWPEDLARTLGWRLALSADPGAGYVNPGRDDLGPFRRLLARLHLAEQDPAIVIVQGGHDDIGWTPSLVRRRVEGLIGEIEQQAPQARIGVLSVFERGDHPPARALAVNKAIIEGARAADPGVMIFDPVGSRWHFPRRAGHLHPTNAGDRWIARRLAYELRRDGALGVVPAASSAPPAAQT